MKDLDRNVPIYGTKMTLGLIEGKFAEHKIKNAKLVEIKPGDQIKLGCFTAEFFAVNHSIPGAVGVFFQSPETCCTRATSSSIRPPSTA